MLVNEYSRLSLYYIIIRDIVVHRKGCKKVDELIAEVRRLYTLGELRDNPIVRAYRDFFWSLGVDPTKVRPASEALARRILQGKGLPRINSVVDAMNAVSAKTLIAMSAFDLDKLSLPLKLRPANGGESFVDISGKKFTFVKNFPLLEDSTGKIVAAVPFRDGYETRITESTKNVFLLAYAPAKVDNYLIKRALKEAEETIRICSQV